MTVDRQSNKADYRRTFQLWDADANEPIDATQTTIDDIQMELEDPRTRNPRLIGSLKTGEIVPEVPEDGVYSWAFPAAEMEDIRDGRYKLGILVTTQGQIIQSAVEDVQVYRGIVGDG